MEIRPVSCVNYSTSLIRTRTSLDASPNPLGSLARLTVDDVSGICGKLIECSITGVTLSVRSSPYLRVSLR